jgi:glutaredoxin
MTKLPDCLQLTATEMIDIVLYTRRECGLCREMEEVVGEVLPRFAAKLDRVEIDGDAELEARFGLEVPVLFVNGRKAFKYRCTLSELRKRLQREAKP